MRRIVLSSVLVTCMLFLGMLGTSTTMAAQTSPAAAGQLPDLQPAPLPANPAQANPFSDGKKFLDSTSDFRPTPASNSKDSDAVDRCNPARDRKSNGVLTDTEGIDLKLYLGQLGHIVYADWKPLMPKEVEKPFFKSGEVKVCFSLLPSGKVEADSLLIARTSGDPALDRAGSGAIGTAIFPPFPKDFTGERLTLLYTFEYNPNRRPDPTRNLPKPPNPLGPIALTVGYTSKL